MRAQIAVREAPPAAGQAKDRVQPQMRRGHIDKHQRAARRQKLVQVAQRGAHIAHGMHHIGAKDEIKGARLEVLIQTGFFDIKDLVFHLGVGCQLLLGSRKEPCGHIAEDIRVHSPREHWQQLRGQASGARADLQNAQSAPLG